MLAVEMPPFLEAVLPLAPAVYRTARRMTHRADDALAVSREALVRAAREDHSAGHGTPLRPRVFAALWQALGGQWRAEGRTERDPDGDTPDRLLDAALAGDEGDFDRALMGRLDASPDVDVAVRRLGERERFVVLMVDVEDCTSEEAAAAMASDLDTIRGLLLSGRSRVFAALFDYARRTSGVHPRYR